jgi:hypothetical protein
MKRQRSQGPDSRFLSCGQSPHPNAKQAKNDDADPAHFHRDRMRCDAYLRMFKQPDDVSKRDQSKNH